MGSPRRVAITGLGAVTPLGTGRDAFWEGLVGGRSGAGPITQFDAEKMKCRIAAEVTDYNPSDHFDTKRARIIERFAQFAIVAAREAHAHSGLGEEKLDPCRIGCVMGVGIGGISFTQRSCGIINNSRTVHQRQSPLLIL